MTFLKVDGLRQRAFAGASRPGRPLDFITIGVRFLVLLGVIGAAGACAPARQRAASAATSRGSTAQHPAVLFTNASIIDPSSASPVTRGSVLVQGDRIIAVGPSLRRPPGAAVIDAGGKYLIPGLWDMHAHLAALTPIARAPEQYVSYGVLGLRDMGSFPDSVFPLRERIRAGERVGPELVLAGPTLNSEKPADFHRLVTTDADARAAVRELKAMGADFIKIHRATNREVFLAIADETRRQGLSFCGHVPLVLGWMEASNAGMRTFEHIQTIYENEQPNPALMAAQFIRIADRLEGAYGDSIFAVMKRNGTWLVPTLIAYETNIERAAPGLAALRRVAYARMKVLAGHAVRAGVPILAGTDVLERHGEMLLTELERLVEIGLTPQQALAAATTSAAAVAGRPLLARVARGNVASFLILDANPLADIRNARSLRMAVLRGRVMAADELARLRAPLAPPAR